MKSFTTKAYQWVDIYRSATDEEIKAAIKTFYKMEYWHDLHVALWAWLSIDGKREKHEWFEKFDVPKVRNDCFACKVAETSFDCLPKWYQEEIADFDEYYQPLCHCCPLMDSSAEECLGGLYRKWYGKWLGSHLEEREKLAKKIATMKWEEKL